MAKSHNRQVSLDSRRIELEREIQVRVPQFDSFVTEYSENISTTGMFIISEKPPPTGTVISFEFSVADDWKLIRGKAKVVWVRTRAEGPDRLAGMGVRFVDIDAQSRRLIRWMVEKHIREGGKPFELDELRSVIDEALVDVLDEAEESVSAISDAPPVVPAGRQLAAQTRQSSSRGRQLAPLLFTAGAVLAVVLGLFWLTEFLSGRSADEVAASVSDANAEANPIEGLGSREAEAANGAESEAELAGEENASETKANGTTRGGLGPVPDAAAGELAAALEDGAAPIGSAYRSVVSTVDAWADAWSQQDADQYLSFYASDFRPSTGLSRRQWASQRRERLQAPRYINVAISRLETERVDLDHVRATFFQNYRSDGFADSVTKTLELVWEDGAWKIRRERS